MLGRCFGSPTPDGSSIDASQNGQPWPICIPVRSKNVTKPNLAKWRGVGSGDRREGDESGTCDAGGEGCPVGPLNGSHELLKAGPAWQFKRYDKSNKLAERETDARKEWGRALG